MNDRSFADVTCTAMTAGAQTSSSSSAEQPSANDPTAFARRTETKQQVNRVTSPWSLGTRLKVGLWHVVWLALFRFTPKPLYRWRVMLLRMFGANVTGTPFVASSAIIKMPWHLTIEDQACIGPHAEIYNLAMVTLKKRSVVAQHCYLCGGSHDISTRELPLVVGPIVIGEEAFIGAKSLVLLGVVVNDGAVIGAGSVVTKDMPAWTICAGNPCKPIRPREFDGKID